MEGDEFFLFLNFGSTIILKVFRKERGVLKYLNLIFLLIMKYLLLQGYKYIIILTLSPFVGRT